MVGTRGKTSMRLLKAGAGSIMSLLEVRLPRPNALRYMQRMLLQCACEIGAGYGQQIIAENVSGRLLRGRGGAVDTEGK